jgi:hypothetical protein
MDEDELVFRKREGTGSTSFPYIGEPRDTTLVGVQGSSVSSKTSACTTN